MVVLISGWGGCHRPPPTEGRNFPLPPPSPYPSVQVLPCFACFPGAPQQLPGHGPCLRLPALGPPRVAANASESSGSVTFPAKCVDDFAPLLDQVPQNQPHPRGGFGDHCSSFTPHTPRRRSPAWCFCILPSPPRHPLLLSPFLFPSSLLPSLSLASALILFLSSSLPSPSPRAPPHRPGCKKCPFSVFL